MPIVTISRGTFSGGKDLAERLARELGYPCISREVIAEAAEQYGASEAALSDALSRAPSFLDRFRRDKERYLAYIRAVLCKHARAGDFIYHGHAGHHLLAGVRHVIRVRVVADMSYRVQAAMQQLNMASHQAEAHIRKVDDERRRWTRLCGNLSSKLPIGSTDPGRLRIISHCFQGSREAGLLGEDRPPRRILGPLRDRREETGVQVLGTSQASAGSAHARRETPLRRRYRARHTI